MIHGRSRPLKRRKVSATRDSVARGLDLEVPQRPPALREPGERFLEEVELDGGGRHRAGRVRLLFRRNESGYLAILAAKEGHAQERP